MRTHALESDEAAGPGGSGGKRWRVVRTRLFVWNRRWLGLFLVWLILLPWLPVPRSRPAIQPSCRVPGATGAPIVGLAFDADGRTLSTLDDRGLVTLWDGSRGWSTGRSFHVTGHVTAIAPMPDGRYLAAIFNEPDVVLSDPRQGGLGRPLGMPVRDASNLKVSPDGRTVAVSSFSSPDIVLWDLDSGRERMTLRGDSSAVIRLAFAPDGRSLASAPKDDRPICVWDLATGRPARWLTGMDTSVLALAFSPDGRLVAGASSITRPVRIWDVRTGAEVLALAGHSRVVLALAFSPDGRALATASGDGTVGLWSVATGRELHHLDGQADMLRTVAFSPDGKTLAATGNDGDVRLWNVDALIGHAG
jgi:WD40 repeat protein